MPGRESESTSGRKAHGLLSCLRAAINLLRKGTYNMQKHTGKITNNGHVPVAPMVSSGQKPANGYFPPSEPWEPIMLEKLKDSKEALQHVSFVLRDSGAYEPGDLFVLLRDIAKAQGGLSKLAQKTGLSRENLYGALSFEGKPRFETIQQVLAALGMRLTVEPLRSKQTHRGRCLPHRSSKLLKSERASSVPRITHDTLKVSEAGQMRKRP